MDGANVIFRDGKIYVRPGMTSLLSAAPSASRVMGGMFYKDHTGTNRTLAASRIGFYLYDGSVWSDITGGTTLTGSTSNQVRFTVFPFSNSTRVIAVNDKDAPQTFIGGATFVDLGGSPPIAKTICSAFQRVILGNVTVGGNRGPSTLRISDFQTPTSWPAANEVNLTDTNDEIVDIRPLSNQMFAIYKTRSQWVGIGAGGIFPFVFELRDQQVGPLSPCSVVVAEGKHYYPGLDGDVYQFDGNRCIAIGGAVKRTIQADLDFSNVGQAHGFYDATNREIWWFWPTSQVISSGWAGMSYRLPYGDIPGAFSTLHTYGIGVSASWSWNDHESSGGWNNLTGTWNTLGSTYATWDAFQRTGRISQLLGATTGQVYKFGQYSGDGGTSIVAHWTTPFRAAAGVGENFRTTVIESFFKETTASTTMDIVLVMSDTLEDNGTLVTAQSLDISNISSSSKIRATYPDKQARFIAVRHEIDAAMSLEEYRGGVIFGYKRAEY